MLKVPIEGPQIEERFWIDQLPEQTVRFGFGHAKAFEPDRWLNDGDRVQVGNVELEVFHCPGHTPGHVVFFGKEDRLAIVGMYCLRARLVEQIFRAGTMRA